MRACSRALLATRRVCVAAVCHLQLQQPQRLVWIRPPSAVLSRRLCCCYWLLRSCFKFFLIETDALCRRIAQIERAVARFFEALAEIMALVNTLHVRLCGLLTSSQINHFIASYQMYVARFVQVLTTRLVALCMRFCRQQQEAIQADLLAELQKRRDVMSQWLYHLLSCCLTMLKKLPGSPDDIEDEDIHFYGSTNHSSS